MGMETERRDARLEDLDAPVVEDLDVDEEAEGVHGGDIGVGRGSGGGKVS